MDHRQSKQTNNRAIVSSTSTDPEKPTHQSSTVSETTAKEVERPKPDETVALGWEEKRAVLEARSVQGKRRNQPKNNLRSSLPSSHATPNARSPASKRTDRSSSLPFEPTSAPKNVIEAKAAIAAARDQPAVRRPVVPRSVSPRPPTAIATSSEQPAVRRSVSHRPRSPSNVVEAKAAIADACEQPAVRRPVLPRSVSPRPPAPSNVVETKALFAAARGQLRSASPRRRLGNERPQCSLRFKSLSAEEEVPSQNVSSTSKWMDGSSSHLNLVEAKGAIAAALEQPALQCSLRSPSPRRYLGDSPTQRTPRSNSLPVEDELFSPTTFVVAKVEIAAARDQFVARRLVLTRPGSSRRHLGVSASERTARSSSQPVEKDASSTKPLKPMRSPPINFLETKTTTVAAHQHAGVRRSQPSAGHSGKTGTHQCIPRSNNVLENDSVSSQSTRTERIVSSSRLSLGTSSTDLVEAKFEITAPGAILAVQQLPPVASPRYGIGPPRLTTLSNSLLIESVVESMAEIAATREQPSTSRPTTPQPAASQVRWDSGEPWSPQQLVNIPPIMSCCCDARRTQDTSTLGEFHHTIMPVSVEEARSQESALVLEGTLGMEDGTQDSSSDVRDFDASRPGAFAVGSSSDSCNSLSLNNSSGVLNDIQIGSLLTRRERDLDSTSSVQKEATSGRQLAEAIAIKEDPEIPAAVEFDASAKALQAKRSKTFRVAPFFCFVFVIIFSGAFSATRPQKNSAERTRRESIFNAVTAEDPDNLLDQSSQSFRQALGFIAAADNVMLPPNHADIVQRFVLVQFYFTTSIKGPWNSCGPSLEGDVLERCIDAAQKRWLSGTTECQWAGVRCNSDGRVLAISCAGFGLSGTIPASISLLPNLKQLILHSNDLEGHIPWSLPKELTMVSVRNNSISGHIPHSVAALPNLRILDLSDNSLTGPIPTQINELVALSDLILRNNHLWGPIPFSLFELENLAGLDIGQNHLTGTIPTEIRLMSALKVLDLESNAISGTLPIELFEMSNLRIVQLRRNKITGRLYSGLGGLSSIEVLDLKDNRLSGSLSSKTTIPESLGELTLSGNRFGGEFPPVFCSPWQDRWVTLQADCKEDEIGRVEVQCSCCTQCCDSNGRQCEINHF